MLTENESIIRFFKELGLEVTSIDLGIASEQERSSTIQISRDSYPGVEPHLVTIADIARWFPELTSSGDIRLKQPQPDVSNCESLDIYRQYWEQLLSVTDIIMGFLKEYRTRFSRGEYPTTSWAHYFMNWTHETWDSRRLEPAPIDSWICYVDPSIRPHIRELNEFGLITRESCSGHPDDHPAREPFWPYVMFEERAYPGISAHLFTLADMACWIPTYGRHGFDVSLEIPRDVELTRGNIESYWNQLISSTRQLMPLLEDYISTSGVDFYTNMSNPSLFRMPANFQCKDMSTTGDFSR
ncbi:MAG: hypothetical protein KGY80_03575 [Candidatus Thorarchaeota archaeon]|nr:hypothetical protein [Candidatus Thorarchaeota archaeon]